MKKPTNETAGKFITTRIQHEEGRPVRLSSFLTLKGDSFLTVKGASFLYDDGLVRAVFHLFPVSDGVYTFTGLVPKELDKHAKIETITQGVALVDSLN